MNKPTDAELDALWRFEASKTWLSTLAMRTSYTRAVLAKWGQPAHSGEPVARLEIGKTKGGVSLTHIAEPAAFQLPEGMYALYTTPQPVERKPLSKEQRAEIMEEVDSYNFPEDLIDATEKAHGIAAQQGDSHE